MAYTGALARVVIHNANEECAVGPAEREAEGAMRVAWPAGGGVVGHLVRGTGLRLRLGLGVGVGVRVGGRGEGEG